MLEIRPPALCAERVRAPLKWHSHSWLCSVQRLDAARDRVAAPESASLRTADLRHSDWQFASNVESISCTKPCGTGVESYSCKNHRGAPLLTTPTQLGAARVPHPPVSGVRFFPARPRDGANLATPLSRAASFWQIGFTARSLAAIPGSRLERLRAREAGSSSPLECALTQKEGWGVSPPAGFSQ